MPQPRIFEPLEMMELRKKAGTVLDYVHDAKQRYIVRRAGQPRALIVPISDQNAIEQFISGDQVKRMYAALEQMEGLIDEDVRDTSQRVDEIVYGEAYDESQQEAHAAV